MSAETNPSPSFISSITPTSHEEQKSANELVEKFEAFAIQHAKPNLDIDKLSVHQVDKVLDIMQQNESNAFSYHCKKLETVEKIKLAEISSNTSGQKTLRILFICTLAVLFIVTLMILFFKETYFINWITFIGGNLSGVGLSRVPKLFAPKKPSVDIASEKNNTDAPKDED